MSQFDDELFCGILTYFAPAPGVVQAGVVQAGRRCGGPDLVSLVRTLAGLGWDHVEAVTLQKT